LITPPDHIISGFGIFPAVLDQHDLAAAAAAFQEDGLERSRAGARHLMRHPTVQQVALDPRLIALACRFLGPSAIPFRATLFDKSPDRNWLVVWHQDTALPLRTRVELPGWGPWSMKAGILYAHAPAKALEDVLALRIHLDESTASNGPLRVLPGTHNRGVLSDEAAQALARTGEPVDCLVPRGGVLAMRPLLLHASSKSQTQARRRVVHIEYAASLSLEGGLELAVA
jgi:ectoine hydroxylase-related dioxygenase (phytanoyl-CoA dioxygenase family)